MQPNDMYLVNQSEYLTNEIIRGTRTIKRVGSEHD